MPYAEGRFRGEGILTQIYIKNWHLLISINKNGYLIKEMITSTLKIKHSEEAKVKTELNENSLTILNKLVISYPALKECRSAIEGACKCLSESFNSGKKLLVCGNGGSAADCEHIVGELMKSFRFKRSRDREFDIKYRALFKCNPPDWLEGSLPAISLVSHTAFMTAFSNDETSRGSFAQQVYGYGQENDVLVGISTSGKSLNVLEAFRVAKAKGLKTISMTGSGTTDLSDLADIAIHAPAQETYEVQEYHLPIYHCICSVVESEIFGDR